MDEDTLTKRARVAEIDRLIELNDRERQKLNGEIHRLTNRRDAMVDEKAELRREQTELLRELVAKQ